MSNLDQAMGQCSIVECITNQNHNPGTFPDDAHVLSNAQMQTAQSVIAGWPSYKPTQLLELDVVAKACGVKSVLYKDESTRFGLQSFKALGGAYAIADVLSNFVSSGGKPEDFTAATATDGNHGRSVAWGAQQAGCNAKIYIHAHVSTAREDAMKAYGADVIRVDGNYEASLAACKSDAEEHGWQLVSDTSWDGYLDVPRQVLAGYSIISAEVMDQMGEQRPTHAFLPVGVGGLASGIIGPFWDDMGSNICKAISVESAMSACFLESIRNDRPTLVDIAEETMMAGLSCGEISSLAWDMLRPTLSHCLSITDDGVAPLMQAFAHGHLTSDNVKIEAGECSTSGLAALIAATSDPALKNQLGLDENSTILLIGTEGATDPALYSDITGINL
ncbi:diaminopropionate ammonia-lyase [Candidatus Puniceispirillum sp.]|uniref:diaminopropionate ammonia-lyase n=1 Tax=Candidatus Puniceispirillum sp. TaxID=2026719 RepID=UPI003F69A410